MTSSSESSSPSSGSGGGEPRGGVSSRRSRCAMRSMSEGTPAVDNCRGVGEPGRAEACTGSRAAVSSGMADSCDAALSLLSCAPRMLMLVLSGLLGEGEFRSGLDMPASRVWLGDESGKLILSRSDNFCGVLLLPGRPCPFCAATASGARGDAATATMPYSEILARTSCGERGDLFVVALAASA